jgi:hypothetical protein
MPSFITAGVSPAADQTLKLRYEIGRLLTVTGQPDIAGNLTPRKIHLIFRSRGVRTV